MAHAWRGYETHAFGHDEISPVSNGTNDSWGALGATLVDALDTLLLMNMTAEFARARAFVATLDFASDYGVSFFETSIRYLGGLLGAYELSRDALFLDKARALADRLMPAFNTSSGIPLSTVNLLTGEAKAPGYSGGNVVLSEAGSVQLEYAYLSHHTGEPRYGAAAARALAVLIAAAPESGLFPVFVDPASGQFASNTVTLGALGDSFYETLVKAWQFGARRDDALVATYRRAMAGVQRELVQWRGARAFVAQRREGRLVQQMDHLIGVAEHAVTGVTATQHRHLAQGVANACYSFYSTTATGLAPEIVDFSERVSATGEAEEIRPSSGATHYILRPEALEAMFYQWRFTGDPIWRERGWQIFSAIERHCKTPAAYMSVRDVTRVPPPPFDSMQSFFLAETLKYAYLLFSDAELLPLDRYVFTTEAHALGIPPAA